MGLNFLVELAYLVLEVVDLQLVEHDDLVVPVLTEQALKAYGA